MWRQSTCQRLYTGNLFNSVSLHRTCASPGIMEGQVMRLANTTFQLSKTYSVLTPCHIAEWDTAHLVSVHTRQIQDHYLWYFLLKKWKVFSFATVKQLYSTLVCLSTTVLLLTAANMCQLGVTESPDGTGTSRQQNTAEQRSGSSKVCVQDGIKATQWMQRRGTETEVSSHHDNIKQIP